MNFYSIRDLRTDAKSLWQTINDGDEAIITNNGKPAAVMVSIPEGYFDESIQAIRQARALIALNSMRIRASRDGYKTDDEINTLIAEARLGSAE
ncbi:MAG: type II toxin-antitoxin system Phd/YefM family antitoxin, partial [Spirochaetales bacterium]|nr:type II toxin-antitoxin system Phd/YefM family antitoxin [Spirochaetales bacterium]